MKQRAAKGKILYLLLLIIAFPLLQHSFAFYESGKLNGAVSGIPDPSFSWPNWWAGTYQQQKNAYLNDNTGCRPDLVRLNNQLDFWLFKKFHAHSVVIGKGQCLFEQEYVDEYYGTDYTGEAKMQQAVMKLKKVQDTLDRMGKTFVFQIAPSKAYFFASELPPSPRLAKPGDPTNYATFKRLADSVGIHQIDYNSWFLSKKKTATDLLMCRLGIHWTTYGSLVAADTFIKYIEHARHIHLPVLHWEVTNHSLIPRQNDNDLASGLNLIYPMQPESLSYPDYAFSSDSATTRPRILYIGDSFLWIWLYDNLMQNLSTQFDIWYYFVQAWNQNTAAGKEEATYVDQTDWHSTLMHSDCITILYVPSSFNSFAKPNSTIDKLYDYFYPVVKLEYER